MNKFIEYVGLQKKSNHKSNNNSLEYEFESTLKFNEEFINAEITKIHLNISTENIKNIPNKSFSFCTVKIHISLEYLDENKFGSMLFTKFTFFKSFYMKNSIGYILKLHNLITSAKLLQINNTRYYIFLKICSMEDE